MRLKQEILLGIGGHRALEALGLAPTVYHMNEGHSAFLALERVRRLMEKQKLSFAEAREVASAGLIFTTHTPVPAGHDYFPPDLLDRYLGDYPRRLGLSPEEFHGAWAARSRNDVSEDFCMTVLALRMASRQQRRQQTARRGQPRHVDSHLAGRAGGRDPDRTRHQRRPLPLLDFVRDEPALRPLSGARMARGARRSRSSGGAWTSIPAEELWRTHERRRERLVAFARRRLRAQLVAPRRAPDRRSTPPTKCSTRTP